MILRKPYALLIQYFQRIHLILILLCAYIFYKIMGLRSFVADFLTTESYNAYYESVNEHINFLLIISILVVIAISIALIILLRYKKKPWKIYLIPVFEYIFMLGILMFVNSYFHGYDELSSITPIMAGRDLLNMVSIGQYVIFIIFGIRFLGIDLKQFGFKNDEEYLDIKEEDREEFEVNIEFDKDKITRNIKRLFRNLKYIYFEHRLVCNTIIIILFASLTGYTYYYFGVLHRTYGEGNTFSANYYDITVNSSYLTNKDSRGNVITDKNSYLVINLTVKNDASKRNINLDRFRVMNKSEGFSHVNNIYDYFKDLGKSYSGKELVNGDEVTFILVYKVPNNLNSNKYVLYYQDVSKRILLKKVKLNVDDVREVETKGEAKITESLKFPDGNNITITDFKVSNETTYSRYSCDDYGCRMMDLPLKSNNKILEISFVSNNFTGKSFIDFSNIYAKIRYEDNNGKMKSVEPKSLISNYNGNYAYFSIPTDIKDNGKLRLVFIFRDERYIYHLR